MRQTLIGYGIILTLLFGGVFLYEWIQNQDFQIFQFIVAIMGIGMLFSAPFAPTNQKGKDQHPFI